MSDPAKQVEMVLGPFEYADYDDLTPGEITHGPLELENGAIYVGSWTKAGLR